MFFEKQILIIDDEKELCFLIAKNLELAGYMNISCASTVEDGLEMAESLNPDLIFLDLNLAGASGLDLMRQIQETNKRVKIIILSGQGTHNYVHEVFEAGAVDFIVKPCGIDKMIELIEKHIGGESNQQKNKEDGEDRTARGEITKVLFFDTLTTFISVSEAKSKYLRGHAERVSKIAKGIGQSMGLTQTSLEILEYSAILHDLGKIGVPDAILDKKGKLTDEEWLVIKSHPLVGSNIISKMRLFRLEEPAIRYHHERFDGKGYPEGIDGANIPMEARIIALADSYDAMTSKRPYRNAMSREDALKEINKNEGTQFDPSVVKHFLTVIAK